MKVRYIKSACVVVEHGNTRVLCDPWLTDGIYYGSWYHYPPLRFGPKDFTDVDYIYISHVHPDHLDVATLAQLDRATPILIHDYEDKFVLRILTGLGFKDIREVSHKSVVDLGGGLALQILAADNCNPTLCGKFFGCAAWATDGRTRQIDSMAVFHAAGQTIVNTNDCPYGLSFEVCDYIRERYSKVDLLLTAYSGAGPYPQCFDNLDCDAKRQRAEKKREQFLESAMAYIRHLRPTFVLPFAGQYTLGGGLAHLNSVRGVPEVEELAQLFPARIDRDGLGAQLVQLDSGEWFDLDSGEASAVFHPPDPAERQRYIDEVLTSKRFAYQAEFLVPPPERVDLTARLIAAQARMLRRQDVLGGYRSEWRIYLDAGDGHFYCVPMDGSPAVAAVPGEEREPFVRITVDYSLLKMILDRKAHWNNAEIGSHLRFYRRPDVYERTLYFSLSHLHD